MKLGGQYIRVHRCWLQLKSKNDPLNIQFVPACKFNNKLNELSAVEPENSDRNIFEIADEGIASAKNDMTNENISDLKNSISNLSLNKEITESENSGNKNDNISNTTKLTACLPKSHWKIVYHTRDSWSWNEALVLGRTSKSTGKHRIWLNMKKLGDNSH